MTDVSKTDLWQLVSAFDTLTKATPPHETERWDRSPSHEGTNVMDSAQYLNNVETLVNQFFVKTKSNKPSSPQGKRQPPPQDISQDTSTLRSWDMESNSTGRLGTTPIVVNVTPALQSQHPVRGDAPPRLRDVTAGTASLPHEDPQSRLVVQNPSRMFDRNQEWLMQRNQEMSSRRVTQEQEEIQGCTFAPCLSEGSRHIRGSHKEREKQRAIAQAQRMAQRQREVDENELSECTFQPLVHNDDKTPCKRYLDPNPSQNTRHRKANPTPDEINCTFKPSIPHNMNISLNQSGLSVFKRLYTHTNEKTPKKENEQPNTQTMQFMIREILNIDRMPCVSKTASLCTQDWMGLEAPHNYHDSDDGEDSVRVHFNVFLQRQNEREKKRVDHLRKLQRDSEPKLKPDLCHSSMELYAAHRERVRMKREAKAKADLEKPVAEKPKVKINFAKMCNDVMERREKRLIKLREAVAAKEMEGVTFHPATKHVNGVTSQLAPERLEDYSKRHAQREKEKLDRSSIIMQKQIEKETEGCTFRPVRSTVPSFVSRMAHSMQTVRGFVSQQEGARQTQPSSLS